VRVELELHAGHHRRRHRGERQRRRGDAIRLTDAVAAERERWREPIVLAVDLLGSDSVDAIAGAFEAWAVEHLGSGFASARWFRRSVGLVVAGTLADGREVVVKAVRGDDDGWANPAGSLLVRRHLVLGGYPCPMPLTDVLPFGAGLASADSYLPPGRPADPVARPEDGRTLAVGLADLVRRCEPLVGHPLLDVPDMFDGLPAGALWPVPHDRRFDFAGTAAGAGWIDDAVRAALPVLAAPAGRRVVSHTDWRAEHVHLGPDGAITATYDWDSVRELPEPQAVGVCSTSFVADFTVERRQAPTLDEVAGFLAAYEDARGSAFDDEERRSWRATVQRSLAYTARCRWSDEQRRLPVPEDDTFLDLLRAWLDSRHAV
jgi:hypothetical protein